jgi:hypothetical protein
MVVGNDHHRSFGIKFERDGNEVVVLADEFYVRKELGGTGNSQELLDCASANRERLIQDALDHQPLWRRRSDGTFEYRVSPMTRDEDSL